MDTLERKLKKYGITKEQYEELLKHSNNTCYICGNPPKTKALCIDHSHKTGKVRGLLCYVCNKLLIGRLGDREKSYELFLKASKYLKNPPAKKIFKEIKKEIKPVE